MRLIDADRLEKVLAIMANQCGGTLDILDISNAIKIAPTVERPHGEWKYEPYGQYLSTYKCSNCGFHGDKQWVSCPYCGADMREGERNEID